MRCPKCGYHSFDGLDNCKSCGNDLTGYRQRFANRGYSAPVAAATVAATAAIVNPIVAATEPEAEDETESPDGEIDFGFDILEAEPPVQPEPEPEPGLPEFAAGPDDWGNVDFTGGEINDPSAIDFPVGDDLDFDNPFAASDDSSFDNAEKPATGELPKLDDRFDF